MVDARSQTQPSGLDTTDFDVFVSHSGTEKHGVVSFIVDELQRRCLRVFVDYEMSAGTFATGCMLQHAHHAPVGVFVLSPDFFKRSWPVREAVIFLDRARFDPPRARILSYFYKVKPWEDVADLTSEQQDTLKRLSEYSGIVQSWDVDFEAVRVKQLADAVESLVPADRRRRSKEEAQLDQILTSGIIRSLESTHVLETYMKSAPSRLLLATYAVVPFIGCSELLDELITWAGSKDVPVSVRVIYGNGGVGKTRMAQELCARLRALGQRAGFLEERATVAGLKSLLLSDTITTAVIDYAEHRQDLSEALRELAAAIQQPSFDTTARITHRLNVLLLARTSGDKGWLSALRKVSEPVDLLLAQAPRLLNSLDKSSPGGPRQLQFESALQHFSSKLSLKMPLLTSMPILDDERFGRVLYVHMVALSVLLEGGVQTMAQNPDRVISRILDHEEHAWRKCVPRLPEDTNIPYEIKIKQFAALACAITLRGGADNTSVVNDLLASMDLKRLLTTAEVPSILAALYPGSSEQFVAPVQPDVLGEALVYRVLTAESNVRELLEKIFYDNSDKALRSAFVVLARMSADGYDADETNRSNVGMWAALILRADVALRTMPAVHALLTLATSSSYDGIRAPRSVLGRDIATVLGELGSVATARQIDTILPHESIALTEVALWTARTLVLDARNRRVEMPQNALIRLHLELSERAWAAGDVAESYEAALSALNLANELYSEYFTFCDINVDEFNSHQAMVAKCFNVLAMRLRSLGRLDEALTHVVTAVNILRGLACNQQSSFFLDLSETLNNLGTIHSSLGNRAMALESMKQSVDILRDLVKSQPTLSHNLAKSLNNLGDRQGILGYRVDALKTTEECVKIYRQLADTRQDTFMPYLGIGLTNLGIRLCALGRFNDAHLATEEAVQLFRHLARTRPDVFRPFFSLTLITDGIIKCIHGHNEAAWPSIKEGMEVYDYVVSHHPQAYLNYLVDGPMSWGLMDRSPALDAPAYDFARQLQKLFSITEMLDKVKQLSAPESTECRIILGLSQSLLGRNFEAVGNLLAASDILKPLALSLPNAYANKYMFALDAVCDRIILLESDVPSEDLARRTLEHLEGLTMEHSSLLRFQERLRSCREFVAACANGISFQSPIYRMPRKVASYDSKL